MTWKKNISLFLQNDWITGFILLGVFLLTNGYIYGWDDQHLEIPLLKSLIDPGLYAGDYYVESLKKNFISVLYPLLAKIISVNQIPRAYLSLYLVSRFFLFFWLYKLWRAISGERLAAFFCIVMIISVGRVEEFLYRTFSHQELALAFIAGGMYFFYRDRYVLSAAMLGLAANFHVLYSVFPFLYMLSYLATRNRFRPSRKDWHNIFRTTAFFAVCAMPVIIWSIQHILQNTVKSKPPYEEWLSLYKLACPQNFIFYDHTLREVFTSFSKFFASSKEYLYTTVFFLVNYFYNPVFRKDGKALSIMAAGTALVGVSFVFTYMFPSKFVIDLNLVRNIQFMQLMLMGYTTLLLFQTARQMTLWVIVPVFLVFPFIRFGISSAFLTGATLFSIYSLRAGWESGRGVRRNLLLLLCFGALALCLFGLVQNCRGVHINKASEITFASILVLTLAGTVLLKIFRGRPPEAFIRSALVLIPFITFSLNYAYYHRQRLVIEQRGGGFWQLQRHWIDMQNYVREHLPKDAVILVPYDMEMGGFRIRSERKIVCSYRDCGIIGFDYAAAVEWKKRVDDIAAFQVMVKHPIEPALRNAIVTYKAGYIVFMKYIHPGGSGSILQPVYENDVFALFKVN